MTNKQQEKDMMILEFSSDDIRNKSMDDLKKQVKDGVKSCLKVGKRPMSPIERADSDMQGEQSAYSVYLEEATKNVRWRVYTIKCVPNEGGEDFFDCLHQESAIKLARYLNENTNPDTGEWVYSNPKDRRVKND